MPGDDRSQEEHDELLLLVPSFNKNGCALV